MEPTEQKLLPSERLANFRYHPPSFRENSSHRVVSNRELKAIFAISTIGAIATLASPDNAEWKKFVPSAAVVLNVVYIYGSRLRRALHQAQTPRQTPPES